MLKKIFFVLFVLLFTNLSGQQENTLFLMHSVPQSNYLNPAIKPGCKVYIGFPLLNTIDINYSNTSFSVNDLTRDNRIQLDEVYNGLPRTNIISAGLMLKPFSFGFNYRNNYFSFSVSEHLSTYVSFKKDLVGLTLHGNQQFIGKVADLSPRLDATYYREYSVGWAFDVDIYNAVGVKGKLLFGKANLGTGTSRILFGTAESTNNLSFEGKFSLNVAVPQLNFEADSVMTGPELVSEINSQTNALNNINLISLLMNPQNRGLAFDFGYINTYVPDFTFSLSLLDFGAILWRGDVNNIRTEANINFDGINLDPSILLDDNTSTDDITQNIVDSLLSDVHFAIANDSYLTFLPTKVFLGAQYHWKKNIDLGLVVRNHIYSRTIKSSATASVNFTLLNNINSSLSWTYVNRSIKNFGVGLAYIGKGFQFYAVTDNVYGFIRPVDTRYLNIRFGMNLMFGCSSSRLNEEELSGHSMVPCPTFPPSRMKKSKKKSKKKLW